MDPWKLEPAHDHGLTPMERFRSLKRESGLISTAMHHAWWSTVRVYMKLWHSLRIEGREHLPSKPPYLIVANHASHLDALVLASALSHEHRDKIFPIAAGDVFFETPIASAFAAMMLNALPMWRKNCGAHAMKQLRERLLNDPCAYIIFPEGGRSRDGKMMDFKAGLGMLVAETEVPVVPCYLKGCFEAMPPKVRFPKRLPIQVKIGPALTFHAARNKGDGWRHIAEKSEQAVRSLVNGPDFNAPSDPTSVQ